MRKPIFIIAEAGVNHNGIIENAFKLIDIAKEAGADAVKFQTFRATQVAMKNAPKADYQLNNVKTESHLEMVKKLELNENQHIQLIEYCQKKQIEFLSSPFDIESVELLVKLGVRKFKIPSGEIVNIPLLRKIGSLNGNVIISSGMATMGEIEKAIHILTTSGSLRQNICVLHCNSEYPTPFSDVNLLAMNTIKNAFHVEVGYSDHTKGSEIPIAAAALGATVIEKHFTIDNNMYGTDHKASMEPDELISMVRLIRNIEKALGDGIKRISNSEQKNLNVVRRSIVSSRKIKIGEVFSDANLTLKRPANGISPAFWDSFVGCIAKRNIEEDTFLTWEDVG